MSPGRSFVWPPKDVESAGAPARQHTSDPPGPSSTGRGGLLQSIERAWLAPTRGVLRERASETGWQADEVGAYCTRCGRDVGPHEETEFGCAGCVDRRLWWSRFVRLGRYESPLADWVQHVKFERAWRLGEALGVRLGQRLLHEGLEASSSVIVPVPTTRWRRLMRGTDHTLSIARGIHRATGARVVRALTRRGAPSQRSVTRSRRAANVSGVFRARPGAMRRVRGRRVVLVDDVTTSGATLRACARSLLAAARSRGYEVDGLWCAVVAWTPER